MSLITSTMTAAELAAYLASASEYATLGQAIAQGGFYIVETGEVVGSALVTTGGAATAVTGTGTALELAATAQLGATSTQVASAGLGLLQTGTGYKAAGALSVEMGALAPMAAAALGVRLGSDLYDANPAFWTKLAQKIVPFCMPGTYDIPAWADVIGESEFLTTLFDAGLLEAIKGLFDDEGIGPDDSQPKTASKDGKTVEFATEAESVDFIMKSAAIVRTGSGMICLAPLTVVNKTTGVETVFEGSGGIVGYNPGSSWWTSPAIASSPYDSATIEDILLGGDYYIPGYYPFATSPWEGISTTTPEVYPYPIIIVPDPIVPDPVPSTVPLTPISPTPLLPAPEPVPELPPYVKPEEWPDEEPWPETIPWPWPGTDPEEPNYIPWPLPPSEPEQWPTTPSEWPYEIPENWPEEFPDERTWPSTPEEWPEEIPWPGEEPSNWPEELPWPLPEDPQEWPEEVPWPEERPEQWPEEIPAPIPWPETPEEWPEEIPWPGEKPNDWPEEIPFPFPVSPEEWPEQVPWPVPWPPEWPDGEPWPIKWPDGVPYPGSLPIPYPTPDPEDKPDPTEVDDPIREVEPYIDPIPWPKEGPDPIQPTEPLNPQDDPSQPDIRPVPEPESDPRQPPEPPPSGESEPPSPPVIPLPFSSTTGLISVYHPTQQELLDFADWLWVTWSDATIDKIWNNPFDGVITLFELYCTPTDVGVKNIRSGFLDSGVSSQTISRYTEIDCGSIGIPEYYGNYLDYSPYSKAYIYLPFIGVVELNVDDIVGHCVNVTYRIDEYNGSCIAMITIAKVTEVNGEDVEYSNVFYQFSGNCAVELPLAGGSQASIKAGMIEAAAWGVGSVIGGVIGGQSVMGAGGIAQGLAYGAASAVHSVVSAKSSVQHSGTFGSSYGAMGFKIPFITVVRPKQIQVANYEEQYGFQAHKAVNIGQCTGYLRCREVHVISPTASDEEKTKIEQLLKEGVYVTE